MGIFDDIAGTGKIPLLSIGIGSHLQMTLPVELLDIFTLLRWQWYVNEL